MFNRVLILAPHTDDAELGCGGTLARFLEEGKEIKVVAFSSAQESLPSGSSKNRLVDEFLESSKTLGLTEYQITVHDFPVRKFSYHRQEVLEELIKHRKSFKPDLVIAPSINDVHQDHQVIINESIRAFKDLSMLSYELPWNHINFRAECFISLEERHINKKVSALNCYRSQLELARPYFSEQFTRGLATTRGVMAKSQFAEAFEVIRIKL